MNFEHRPGTKRTDLKRSLVRLIIARSDIDAACHSCELFIRTVDHLGHDLYYPLFTSMVICYARPFIHNKTIGQLPKRWGQFRNPAYRSVHEDILRARNNIVAHSDVEIRKVYVKPPFVNLPGTQFIASKIGFGVKTYYFPLERFPYLLEAFKDLRRRMFVHIEGELEELYRGMDLPRATFRVKIDEGL